ncbi:MAG: DUF58 domain-containing protein [Bacillota bacterium]|nr:DUF58 domain-containing protein [Bacillota bacterium]
MEEKIFNGDFFKKLNSINFNVRTRLSGGAQGGRRSRAKGSSVEFSDFREYVPGDDFRRIDWNAYGRFDRLFVKLFMEEKEANFNIFIDSSKSMDFGQDKKSHMALKIAAALSYIILNNLDRVYISSLKDGNLETSRGASGKMLFQRLLKDLSSINFEGGTDLAASIMKRKITCRGVSIIISDFFDAKAIEEALKYLAYKKQEIILVNIFSKEELHPEFEGVVNLIDSETGEELRVSLTPSILKEYKLRLDNFCNNLEALAFKYGAPYIKVSSEEPLEKVILKNFTSKGLVYKE